MPVHDLCISGASISRCPWLTWVDCLIETLRPVRVTNHSCKGAGNQYIISSALHALHNKPDNKFLAIMLTNFDKYDMWVSGQQCQDLQGEKHPPHWINGQPALDQGFWCTGSHFPLIKQHYQEHFFNIDLSAAQDLNQTLGLIKYCQEFDIPCLVMFDSPAMSYSEQQINRWYRYQEIPTPLMIKQSLLVQPAWSVLKSHLVDESGLIGFCMDNNLPWYNSVYGPHPPSISHYHYFQQQVLPWIRSHYPWVELQNLDEVFVSMIDRMTDKWQKNAF